MKRKLFRILVVVMVLSLNIYSFAETIKYTYDDAGQAIRSNDGVTQSTNIYNYNGDLVRQTNQASPLETPIISTIAGTGTFGYNGDNILATSAQLWAPHSIEFDSKGNLYTADSQNQRIRKVDTNGIISTVAGNGTAGFSGDGGPATAAQFVVPSGVAVDSQDNIYIADSGNSCIRMIDAQGIITTVAGNANASSLGDNNSALAAGINWPMGMAFDKYNNLYIVDVGNKRIRKVDTSGIITTVAGNGKFGYNGDGIPATAASLSGPMGVALDSLGNLFIAEANQYRIRKVDTNGIISTVAGTGTYNYAPDKGDGGPATSATLNLPLDVEIDKEDNLYIADSYYNRIRKVDTNGIITTIAGTGGRNFSGDGGPAISASLFYPSNVALDNFGNLFINDQNNIRIRKVTFAVTSPRVPTNIIASPGNAIATISFNTPTDNGGSAITSYTVTSSPGGKTSHGTGSPITITDLTNGTAYTFTVTATNAAGNSADSTASASITPVAPVTAPGSPTNVTAIGGNGKATVSFTTPASNGRSPITSYKITSSPGGINATGTGSPIAVTGLTNGTNYTFTVTATNAAGTGAPSAASGTVKPAATVPGIPTGISAVPGNAKATVSFTAPTDNGGSVITGYTVTASPGGRFATGTGSPITITGLTNGTAYTFTVKANNIVGPSPASAASASVIPATTPGAPTSVKAVAGNGKATITFAAPVSNGGSPITNYTVTSSPGGKTANGTSSPITITGLTNGTYYTFTVKATNGVGKGAASSASSRIKPAATVPGAPTNVSAAAGNKQATITFTAPADNGGSTITGYTVTASPGGRTATGTGSPITITGLTNGTAYTFTVKANNGVGIGPASTSSNSVKPTP